MSTDYWREQIEHIILNSGDMIVDIVTQQYGVLVKRERKISYAGTDIYFWLIRWSVDIGDCHNQDAPNPDWIEEDGLKLSVVIGFYDLHPQD
jgi:hypothetical protein|tara:strand:- start:2561 stop:2836 length:276 start_codon:yes stop_codon:yes gene_type:complete